MYPYKSINKINNNKYYYSHIKINLLKTLSNNYNSYHYFIL